MLQFFSASTSIVNSRRAITECLENALVGQPNLDCDLIIIYSHMGHNFKDVLGEARKISPGARIAGCTGTGIIGKNGADESISALAIMAIKGPKNEFTIVSRKTSLDIDPYQVTAEMARELKDDNPNIKFIQFNPPYLFWTPFDRTLEGIKSVFGQEIPLFGGPSCFPSYDTNLLNSVCFIDDQVIERGAIMVGFADPTLKFISQANHGISIIEGVSFEVTRSESNHIFELNNKPAWKFLTELLGVPETATWIDTLTLAHFLKEFPGEIEEEYGSKYILDAPIKNYKDYSFDVMNTCREGTILTLGKRTEKGMFEGVDRMVKRILDKLNGKKPQAVFHAECATRGRSFLNQKRKEELINSLQYPLCQGENVPWLGFYCAGEFSMLGGEAWLNGWSSSLFVIYRE